MSALFIFVLPFGLYFTGYGFYCLGRSLVRLVPVLWARLQRNGGGK